MSGERVTIYPDDAQALVKPLDYLGDSFRVYLAACKRAGATFDKAKKAQVVKLEKVGVAVHALEQAGFVVEIDESLKDAVESDDGPKAAVDVDKVVAELAARGLRPYPYQVEGIRWLASHQRTLLGDDMGLGKTMQSLLAAPRGAPILVVCPASLKGVWRREARLWRPDLLVTVLKGRDSFRWPAAPRKGAERAELVICNWDILPQVENESYQLPGPPEGVVVIADEAQAVKNSKGRRAKNPKTGRVENMPPLRTMRFRAVSKAAQAADGWVWPMTGTPIENRPLDLWNILEAASLGGATFGGWHGFLKAFGGYKGQWGLEFGSPSPEVPRMLRATMLRRKRTQVLPDLPVKTWTEREVEVDDDTRAMLDEVQEEILGKLGVDLGQALDEVAASKFMVAFETNSRARAALATAKIPALLDIVAEYEDAEEPLVVFSMHRKPIEVLREREGWGAILGDTSQAERDRVVQDFQAGLLKGVALTIKAGGTGLTLTHAAHEVFVDLAWTPSANAQAEDRCCRIGQTRGVLVTRLVADHLVDERVVETLTRKQALIDQTVEKATTHGAGEQGGRVYVPNGAPDNSPIPTSNQPGTRPGSSSSRYRGPQDELEEWAAETLTHVARSDPDHAAEINGVGFSKFDGEIGHSLAGQILDRGMLTDRQWALAKKLANKYRRQACRPQPEGEPNE